MQLMFDNAKSFNGDLSKWDVSRVTNMHYMFEYAISFHGDLSKWDVSSVTTMASMFYHASSFKGGISKWDVSSVTDMHYMFRKASAFAETLCGMWVTATAITYRMFEGSYGRFCTTTTSNTTFIETLTLTLADHNPDFDFKPCSRPKRWVLPTKLLTQ